MGAMTAQAADQSLEFDLAALLDFMRGVGAPVRHVEGMQGIGLRRRGALVAAVVFERFNGRNIWCHIAAIPGRHWLTRYGLMACLAYPFMVCGVDRLTAQVVASNRDAVRFVEHVGFVEEARLRGAASDGGDVILFVLWKKDCRYVV